MAADSHDHTVVVHVTPGEVLDHRWRVERRIGQGAMGSVFRGRDLGANKVVAIKILAPEHCRKPKLVARFEREAEKMTGLRHPNLVAFEGHGRRGALPFIVMEFLEGLTLSEVLEQNAGKLLLPETVAIVRQVGSGLSFLHQNGLVHRDIKPQNVFLSIAGRVTILDLGVVRDQANPGLTRPGAMVGTPYYMSPEQILGVEDIDHRTDVYALAAVTFELLTGRPPYLGTNNFEVLYGHKNSPTPDAAALVKSIPRSVAQVLMQGMAKQRDERHASVLAFVSALESAAGVKKVNLAKALAIGEKKTRVVARHLIEAKRPPPPVPDSQADDAPDASNSDVVSVPGLALPEAADTSENKPDTGEHARTPIDAKLPSLDPRSMPVPALERRPDQPPPPPISALEQKHDPAPPTSPPLPVLEKRSTPPPKPDAREQKTVLFHFDASAPRKPKADPRTGQLRVVVTNRGNAVLADITVDGEAKGTSPQTLALSPGVHHVKISLAGFRTAEQWATVTVGGSITLRVLLERTTP